MRKLIAQCGRQGPPQLGHVRVQDTAGIHGCPFTPHPVDQRLRADHPARVGGEGRDHGALLRRSQPDDLPRHLQLQFQFQFHGPEQVQPCHTPASRARRRRSPRYPTSATRFLKGYRLPGETGWMAGGGSGRPAVETG